MRKRYIGDFVAISSIFLMIFVFLFVIMDDVKATGWKAWSILASISEKWVRVIFTLKAGSSRHHPLIPAPVFVVAPGCAGRWGG